jgi:hypothetical protein
LALAGITDMAAANRYLKNYLPAFNQEFVQPAMEEGSAFVGWIGLDDSVLSAPWGTTTASALKRSNSRFPLTVRKSQGQCTAP